MTAKYIPVTFFVSRALHEELAIQDELVAAERGAGFHLPAAAEPLRRGCGVGRISNADGVIGKVYLAKGLCFKRRVSIGHKPDSPAPAGVNWDLFLGPAPMRAFNELRLKYNWHWFWDTGNGDIGNQGIHEMDIARWGLGVKYPTKVSAIGGKFSMSGNAWATVRSSTSAIDLPRYRISRVSRL
jgi:hypothetical protein